MSGGAELIELRELRAGARPGRGRLERANALRIGPARRAGAAVRDPRLTAAPGAGHRFQPRRRGPHTWCDLCGDFIWGARRKSLQCLHCSFTCHYRCRALVRLDCSGPQGAGGEDGDVPEQEVEDTNVDDPGDAEELEPAQLEQRIREYNSQINSNLFMSLNKDGSYSGFIRVQLRLARPVAVPAAARPPCPGEGRRAPRRRASFYLPAGTAKHLHVTSRTPAAHVVAALLAKFMVLDDPRKFALFERREAPGPGGASALVRKLGEHERPLRLRLLAGPGERALGFVLKENDSGEVQWEAFSLPELQNFLRLLQRKEEERVRQVRRRYERCRQRLREALAARRGTP
ncbi:ras association domain-containing protein 1 [Eudromia elegans]